MEVCVDATNYQIHSRGGGHGLLARDADAVPQWLPSVMPSKQKDTFDARAFLDSAGVSRKIKKYRRDDVIFTQGDPSRHVLYIQHGGVKLSVLSKIGDRPSSQC